MRAMSSGPDLIRSCRVETFVEPMRGRISVQKSLKQTAGHRCFLNRDHPVADSGGQAGQGRGNVRRSCRIAPAGARPAAPTVAPVAASACAPATAFLGRELINAQQIGGPVSGVNRKT